MWTVGLRVDMAQLSWCGPVEGRGEETLGPGGEAQ